MKKFSTVSGFNVSSKPDDKENIINEADVFKTKLLSLMERYLSIKTYGPIDRYLREGSIKITGQELFAEAVLGLFEEKTIKEQAKVLESLKSTVKDWESIDSKIDSLNQVNDFKISFKIKSLVERYGDTDLLIDVIENKNKKIKDNNLLEKYRKEFAKTNIKKSNLSKIDKIYLNRINELKKTS